MTPGTVAAPAPSPSSGGAGGAPRANRASGADAFGAFLAGATDVHAEAGRRDAPAPARTAPEHRDQHGHAQVGKPASTAGRQSLAHADGASAAPRAEGVAGAPSPVPDAGAATLAVIGGDAVAAVAAGVDAPVTAAVSTAAVPTAAAPAGPAADTIAATLATRGKAVGGVPVAGAAPALVAGTATDAQDSGVAPTREASTSTAQNAPAPSNGSALPVASASAEVGRPQAPVARMSTAPAPVSPAPGVAVSPSTAPDSASAAATIPTEASVALPLASQRGALVAQDDLRVAPAAPVPVGAAAAPATSRPVVPVAPAAELQNRSASTAEAIPGVPAPIAAVPVPASTAVAAPIASSAPASAPQPQTLDAQLARPVFTLAAAGRGEHVMTVHVTPDNLGPVTVRAHVGVDGVRVELFAPTDAGRDALRAILPDLRRDLGSTGLAATLDLSSQNQPSPQQHPLADGRTAGQQGERPTGHDSGASGDGRPRSSRGNADRDADRLPHPVADGSTYSIDLIV